MHVKCALNDDVLSNADNRPEVPLTDNMGCSPLNTGYKQSHEVCVILVCISNLAKTLNTKDTVDALSFEQLFLKICDDLLWVLQLQKYQ
jgi:hypothetical protein